MKSKQYIYSKLKELHSQFPNLTIKYKHDSYTQMHIVDIMPLSEYENNEEFIRCETEIGYEFDNLFFPESVMFISSESLTELINPEIVIEPVISTNLKNDLLNESFYINFCIIQGYENTINDSNNYSLAA